jgi:hypothetical protein
MSVQSWCFSLFREWRGGGADVMSVIHHILDHLVNGGWSQMVTDILSQHKPHGESASFECMLLVAGPSLQ